MELKEIIEFKSSPKIREKLESIGFTKTFAEGETILNENDYIRAIPIVTNGSIRVMRMDEDGREILLYYIKAGESCIMSFLGAYIKTPARSKPLPKKIWKFFLSLSIK